MLFVRNLRTCFGCSFRFYVLGLLFFRVSNVSRTTTNDNGRGRGRPCLCPTALVVSQQRQQQQQQQQQQAGGVSDGRACVSTAEHTASVNFVACVRRWREKQRGGYFPLWLRPSHSSWGRFSCPPAPPASCLITTQPHPILLLLQTTRALVRAHEWPG